MKASLFAYLSVVAISATVGLAFSGWFMTLSADVIWLSVLVMLAHAPGMLTVRQLRYTIPAPKALKGFDEVPVLLVVLLAWICVGLGTPDGPHSVTGLFFVVPSALGFAAVRACPKAGDWITRRAGHIPKQWIAPLLASAQQCLYWMRIVSVLTSFLVLEATLVGATLPLWLFAVIGIVLCGLLFVLSVSLFVTTDRAAKDARIDCKARLRKEIEENDLSAFIYVCGRSNAYLNNIASLAASLARQGIRIGFLVREKGAVSRLAKLGAFPIFEAPTLASLDNYVTEDSNIRAVFYLNDAVRNGHFTRFQQFLHILVTTPAMTSPEQMPRSFAMYDVVVVKKEADALRWRMQSDVDLAERVATIGVSPQGKKSIETVHIRCGREAPGAQISPDLLRRLRQVSKEATCSGLRLMLSIPAEAQRSDEEQALASIIRAEFEQTATIFEASGEAAAHFADVQAVLTAPGAARAQAAGRAVLWIGNGAAPNGLVHASPGELDAAIEALSKEEAVAPSLPGRTFERLVELLPTQGSEA